MLFRSDDSAIVQAARVSYGRGTKTKREDRNLIRYLMRMQHTSPFEQCEIKLHVKMPIFVARQWVRHRTASLNEYSGRYSVMPSEFYKPCRMDVMGQGTVNKQGSEGALSSEVVTTFLDKSTEAARECNEVYLQSIENGVARETARITLPLSVYTEMYWKIDLRNLFHFLSLRLDKHAQWEFRQYAVAIAEIVKDWVPMAWEAFEDFQLRAITLSVPVLEVLQGVFAGAGYREVIRREMKEKNIPRNEVDSVIDSLGL